MIGPYDSNVSSQAFPDEGFEEEQEEQPQPRLQDIRVRDTKTGRFVPGSVSMLTNVNKSYVPGQGWVAAAKAGKATLRAVKPGRYKAMGGRSAHDQEYMESRAAFLKDEKNFTKEPSFSAKLDGARAARLEVDDKGVKHYIWPKGAFPIEQAHAAAIRMGGKRDPGIMLRQEGAPQGIIDHEMAHLKPKRSGYRMSMQGPEAAGREEARADAAAGLNYRNKDNPIDSGYHSAARGNLGQRSNQEQYAAATGKSGHHSKSYYHAYRDTQDKIFGQKRNRTYGNEKWDRESVKTAGVNAGFYGAVGGTLYGAHNLDQRSQKRRTAKFHGNQHMTAQGVHKAMPDMADVHVLGSGVRLRKITRGRGKRQNKGD